jgi:hypothetical protein
MLYVCERRVGGGGREREKEDGSNYAVFSCRRPTLLQWKRRESIVTELAL